MSCEKCPPAPIIDNVNVSFMWATFTVYVDMPDPLNDDVWTFDLKEIPYSLIKINYMPSINVGHTWWMVDVSENGMSEISPDLNKFVNNKVGLYPKGLVENDIEHTADEIYTYYIKVEDAEKILKFTQDLKNSSNYDLCSNNCTTAAINAGNIAGVKLPATKRTWPGCWNGYSPGQLGFEIKEN